MKLQKQTIFGKPYGNCFATCVACIFGLDVSEVPNFCAPENGEGGAWFEVVESWCRARGWLPLNFPSQGGHMPGWVPPGCVTIASGPAARGLDHATVYRGSELLWDPHPSDAGLERIDDFILFVALDPGAMALGAPMQNTEAA